MGRGKNPSSHLSPLPLRRNCHPNTSPSCGGTIAIGMTIRGQRTMNALLIRVTRHVTTSTQATTTPLLLGCSPGITSRQSQVTDQRGRKVHRVHRGMGGSQTTTTNLGGSPPRSRSENHRGIRGDIPTGTRGDLHDHEELRRKVGGEHAEHRSLIGLDVAGEEGHRGISQQADKQDLQYQDEAEWNRCRQR